MKIKIGWSDPNYGAEEIRLYSDTAPMDPQALPAPLATLGPDIVTYTHDPVTSGQTYHYILSAIVGGQEYLSDEFSQIAELPAISQFFSAGEQGVWYDPSDRSTMFQDTGATIPVAADGDPVRYLMDKSGNAVHLSHSTGLVYRTDGAHHWLEFNSTYLVASGSKTKMAFAHSPLGGFTGAYGVRFGNTSNPSNIYVLYSNGGATSSKRGINGWYDDRPAQARNDAWAHLTGRGSTPQVVNPVTANGFVAANTDLVISEMTDPDASPAADRHFVRLIGGTDQQDNTTSGTASAADATDEFYLGASSGALLGPMVGRLYQFVMVEGQLSASDRELLELAVSSYTP